MDIRKINKLIELAKATGVNLEIETKEGHIKITHPAAAQATQVMLPAPAALPAQLPATDPAPQTPPAEPPSPEGHNITAPMVGSVYLAPTPGAKPFVEVGDRVEVGDTLCLIEAMKMFNQIEADRAGTISARMVDNQAPVEYDQILFIITED